MKQKKLSHPYQTQAAEWLKYADNDFTVAKDNFELGHFSYVCQLCQQAAEKYLKAFLVYHQIKPEPVHILGKLLSACQKIDPKFADLVNSCKNLEDYYLPTRYPIGPFGIYTQKDAQEALGVAETIINFIKEKLTLA